MTPNKLGRYEVLRVIGKGAMGVVYEGRDPNLDRRVAIKTVQVENLSAEAAAEYEHRFRTEARSAARLQHPNIVSVYDSGREGNSAFLVMEYIQGEDLKHHLDRGIRYTLEQALRIVRDLLGALDYAHKQGIVHRDIKPANLLIEPAGRVKLTDFGVARIQDSGEATRTQGSMVGTLKYMAPEQVQGQPIDSRADLFSAGVMLYQLLTGKRPFDGENDFSIIHQIIGHTPAPPSRINSLLPTTLDPVLARALAKDRNDRFATARDFAVALQAAVRPAEDQTVVPPPDPTRPERAPSRPLTVPGTLPGGATSPSAGSQPSVAHELELVYWKDVKDASDPEELHGFLERFPAGIYADLARRRLRKLSGGEQTDVAGATRPGAGAFAASVFPHSAFPNEPSPLPTEPALPTSDPYRDVRPVWEDGDFTRTVTEPAPASASGSAANRALGAPAAAAAQGAAGAHGVAAVAAPAVQPDAASARPAASAQPLPMKSAPAAPARSERRQEHRTGKPAAARKNTSRALLAGVAVVAVAGLLGLVLARGSSHPQAGAAVGADVPLVGGAAPAAGPMPAPAPASVVATAPADAPAAADPAPAPPRAAHEAEPPKKAGKTAPAQKAPGPAKNGRAVAPASPADGQAVALAPPVHVEAEPPARQPAPAVAATNANYQAVDQCRERLFLAKEVCLAEHCDQPGARSHPLCVKRRDDARLREDSKQMPAR